MKIKKILIGVAAMSAAFLFAIKVQAQTFGSDNAKYQGNTFVRGRADDKFGISQIGGAYGWSLYPQTTYHGQVATGIAQGLMMHSYIYLETGSNQAQTKAALDYYLPKIQTPKGSIVAIDYESGASNNKQANTDNLEYAFKRVKDAGYTPLLYSGTYYLKANVNYDSFFDKHPNSFWVASYATMQITTTPNFAYFPTFRDVAVWQYTSMARAEGLDHNVDLLNVTSAGYKGKTTNDVGATTVKPKSNTSAINAGRKANDTNKHTTDLTGYTVKVNFTAKNWYVGGTIPSWVKGKSYTVQDGSSHSDRVLLGGVLSWIKRSDIEVLQTKSQTQNASNGVSGAFKDGNYTINRENGTFTANQTLRVFAYPGVQPTGAHYYAGESVKYDGYIVRNGYVYISYVNYAGYHHYIAVRQNGVPLGTFR